MRESASTDLREPQGSNPLGPPGPELCCLLVEVYQVIRTRLLICSLNQPGNPAIDSGILDFFETVARQPGPIRDWVERIPRNRALNLVP